MSDVALSIRLAATAALETSLNRILAMDPAAALQLAKLDGQVIHICLSNPQIDLFIIPQQQQLAVQSFYDGPSNTQVSGKPSDFLELMLAKDPASALINGNITVKGSASALIDLQKVFKNTRLDWEFELSKLVGDFAAHEIGKVVAHSTQWLKQQRPKLDAQLKEIVYNEARLLASREEIRRFCNDVDDLSARLDRLEARIKSA